MRTLKHRGDDLHNVVCTIAAEGRNNTADLNPYDPYIHDDNSSNLPETIRQNLPEGHHH